ncbi:phytanoyl-CoA dioxygenase family protein [Streptomyces sp. NPDC059755]|uniref:phytanoyl-CoA dioxygenase family protein n=1 Tax=Streptomyces sp. NPDC059755 TaxID=3346934 RepID=UPI0036529EFC
MELTASPQSILENYRRDGYVFFPSLLDDDLQDQVSRELPEVLNEDGPQRFFEEDGKTVRAVYGLHQKKGIWKEIAERSPIARIARLLLEDEMYVYQWKINPKSAFSGEQWEWHRDFTFWAREDGMPTPAVLTAGIFFDETTEENGPLQVVPGSHLDNWHADTSYVAAAGESREANNWSALVSANLSHSIPGDEAESEAEKRGLFRATGRRGSVIFFHGNIIHGSMPNRSEAARTLGLITYNSVGNTPKHWSNPRPDFFVSHDPTPLKGVSPLV